MPGFPELFPPTIEGRLLPRYFLDEGLPATQPWTLLSDAEVDAFAARVAPLFDAMRAAATPSEAETEKDLIFPILDALGWESLPQQGTGQRSDTRPDALLFANVAVQAAARAHPRGSPARLALATVVAEHKAWGVQAFDTGSGGRPAPAHQVLRYLREAEDASDGRVQWGLLTNGRVWRLYFAGVAGRAERYLEADLDTMLAAPGLSERRAGLRRFLLLFRPDAHQPDPATGRSFLADALAEGRRYETRITAALTDRVFERVFPDVVAALAEGDPLAAPNDAAWRAELGRAAMVLLYRCLFVLYAEDRHLLPVTHPGYQPYSFRALRDDAAKVANGTLVVSPAGGIWWARMKTLFTAIAKGERSMGLPPYNGGLFDDAAHPLLARAALRDRALADLIEALSREGPSTSRHMINFRDLSVQHLGAIYEGLLEREVAPDRSARGGVTTRPNAYARRTSGSYYTPEELVLLVIRRAVGPLLAERMAAFRDRAEELASERGPREARAERLRALDPATAYLGLRACDPAMGSGHFLVSLVDYLADATVEATAEAAKLAGWCAYRSPLTETLAAMRDAIKARAAAGGWAVRDSQLDDKSLVRRIILKRVVHGVDLNPMAVELAKLSLWLHSFTVGAPLSFLDHHLRCGDALFGEFVRDAVGDLRERYGWTVPTGVIAAAESGGAAMGEIERRDDSDIAQVEESKQYFGAMEAATAPLRRFLDLHHAAKWLPPTDPAGQAARDALFEGGYGDPVALAGGAAPSAPRDPASVIRLRRRVETTTGAAHAAAIAFLDSAAALGLERRFLHWELAFPNVWRRWQGMVSEGGFDAVIGNPPWDRMKLQEVEWFADRVPEIARQGRAADRKRMIARLRAAGGDLADAFAEAEWAAEAAARVAREGGAYPLLSGGDVNLYSLFVERALRLLDPKGIAGMLVPSGIAADKGAAAFFRQISTTGRLGALFDFENGLRTPEPFFPDVHPQFKFSALVVAGTDRRFAAADCAFYQSSAEMAETNALQLAPSDFEAVNPNTGTAPAFRSKRDAQIVLDVYRRVPVMVDRRRTPPTSVWPVRYSTMFHMTNDSDKFRTEQELTGAGAYRVAPNRWRRGGDEWVPLMVGKTIWQFDHRFASAQINSEALHVAASSDLASEDQHADPNFSPSPQFWVAWADVAWPTNAPDYAIAFRDITNTRNQRTVIAALVPRGGAGNKLPLLLPSEAATQESYRQAAPLLLANLNSLVLDFIGRMKIQWTNLNAYILEQLPILPLTAFGQSVGSTTAEAIIRDHVLRLTYTAHDLDAFARDQGYAGAPFRWDAEERLHLRARLDALFFLLYGLNRDAAGYILGTFPIVAENEVARWGRFRSRDLILGYMAALAAGDTTSRIAG
jgi:hypothetical protein